MTPKEQYDAARKLKREGPPFVRPSLPDLPLFCDGPFRVNLAGWIVGVDAFGGMCHVADVRGRGYLIGQGLALALSSDEAIAAQDKTAQFIVDAMNEKLARYKESLK